MWILIVGFFAIMFILYLIGQIQSFFDPHASERERHEREEYNEVVKKDNSSSLVTNDKVNFSDNIYRAKYYPIIHYSISYESYWIRFKYVLTEEVEYVRIENWKLYNGSFQYDRSEYCDQLKPHQKTCNMNINVNTLFTQRIMIYIIVKPVGKQPYKYKEVFNA